MRNNVNFRQNDDFVKLRARMLEGLTELVSQNQSQIKRWLRSNEVQEFLGISASSLQNLRKSGVLPYAKLNGVIYFDITDINRILELKKVCVDQSGGNNE